ncbi:LysR family transcriptional regulator [Pleurocapsa sp. PCC 7319]|uniref:LysR family transcriptional regulator n=1 Tax=Pleurocapsa sp. PCC 7319 TaxID=118161 RepID=UPI00034BA67F|nr:LysR family transcriptional regulator [Pleurocapsa sp. PCC 7319]
MELRQLRYFVAVAQELHFGKAAERLQITQPALSKQIRVLETELEIQLFIRTKRTVNLTKAGEVFFAQAQQLLQQAEEAIQLAKRTASGEVGRLNIGFTATATYTVLPELIRKFRSRYPQVEVEMLELCTEAQVATLNRGEIDLGFLHPPIDSRGLEIYPILSEDFILVLPPQHHLIDKQSLSFKDLAGESFLIHPRQEGPFLYDRFLKLCRQAGFQPQIVKEVTSHQTRICLVAAGMGITFIPAGLQTLVSQDLIYKPIENSPIKLEFAAAWRSLVTMPVLQEFLILVQSM